MSDSDQPASPEGGTREVRVPLLNRRHGTRRLTDRLNEPAPASPTPADPFARLKELEDEIPSFPSLDFDDEILSPAPKPATVPAPKPPRPAPAAQAPAPPVAPSEPATTGGPLVVVIEDDELIAYTLEYVLKREGFRVQVCADGRAAKDFIDGNDPPDLLLLDILLPYFDGFQLVEHVRHKPFWSQVPIVMLTSNGQERDIVRALTAGANDYLVKPFQLMELIARLRRLVRTRL